MNKLPLNCVFYLSTAGHYSHLDVYQTTIKHYKARLGGSFDIFQCVYAHIKVKPSQRDRLPDMIDFLLDEGIHPIVTEGDWQRGLNHGASYLADMLKVYGTQELHNVPYAFAVEDDSPINVRQGFLAGYLDHAVQTLAAHHDIIAIRFQRDGVSNQTWPVNDLYHRVDTYDFQPTISRIKDLYLGAKLYHDNAAAFANTQCEAAFRIASDALSYAPHRYLCFNPALASSHHIGAANYPEILKTPEFANL